MLGAIVRHRLIVAVSIVISIAATMTLGPILLGSPGETAQASLVLSEGTSPGVGATDQPERFVANQVEVIRSVRVTERAVQVLRAAGIADTSTADLQENLVVVDQPNSDRIVVSYTAPEGPLAIAVVDAVLEAYRDIRGEQSAVVADEAVDRIDAELELVDQRLATITGDIEELESSNPLAQNLASQALDAVERIGVLQAEMEDTEDPTRRNQIIAELADLRARVDLFLSMEAVSLNGPELQLLLASQERAIERRAALVLSRDQILIDSSLTPSVVAFEDPAVLTNLGAGLTGWRALAVGLIAGLIVGTSIAVAKSSRRALIEDRNEVVEILKAPLLAAIPDFRAARLGTPLPVRDAPDSDAAEAYRFALSSLETTFRGSVGHIALVASSQVGQGKTTSTANLALAAASLGYQVLAIDADFGDQDLTKLFDASSFAADGLGLTDLLDGRTDVASTLWKVPLAHPLDLQLMVRGSPVRVPSETLQSESAREAISHLRLQFDLILVDGPPLLKVAYATSLLRLVDSVIAVVPRGSDIRDANDFRKRCDLLNREISGFLFTHDTLEAKSNRPTGSARGVFEDAAEGPAPISRLSH